MSRYPLFLLANCSFASSIYAYNSPNSMVNLLYAPGLYLTFLLYRALGAIVNN